MTTAIENMRGLNKQYLDMLGAQIPSILSPRFVAGELVVVTPIGFPDGTPFEVYVSQMSAEEQWGKDEEGHVQIRLSDNGITMRCLREAIDDSINFRHGEITINYIIEHVGLTLEKGTGFFTYETSQKDFATSLIDFSSRALQAYTACIISFTERID